MNDKPVVLIIDDEQSICDSLIGVFSDEGWTGYFSLSGKEGLKQFRSILPDLVLLDVWMPGMDGIETLQSLKELRKDIPIVIMSGHANIETAVKATKLGAFDFLEKPLSLDKLLPILDYALEIKQKRNNVVSPDQNEGENVSKVDKLLSSVNKYHEIIGESDIMLEIKKQVQLVAPRNAWILITGENGTGKEVLAHQIHKFSHRNKNPFIAINCAAIPEELIEAELFGYEKGAFTNAYSQRKGKFELADKGTLFLDEIGDMSLKTQAKILRILQEQKFERLGGSQTLTVDVRVIAATNQDLQRAIKEGRFREDLYYRLNVVPLCMPPLRRRSEDIKLLLYHFLKKFAKDLNEEEKRISDEALLKLEQYHWPGNVRELKNLIERLCIMVSSPVIDVKDLPSYIIDANNKNDSSTNYSYDHKNIVVNEDKSQEEHLENLNKESSYSLKQAKEDFEKNFILSKLQENDGNIAKTADSIGLERSNLYKKLKSYGIDPKQMK